MTSNEIGSYETKTKPPELLRGGKHDNRQMIAAQGKTVDELLPAGSSKRLAVTAVHDFMQLHPPMLGIDTKALIVDGRD